MEILHENSVFESARFVKSLVKSLTKKNKTGDNMFYKQKVFGDIVILEINQEISSQNEASFIKNYLVNALNKSITKLVIDCRNIDYIDSAFLGAMVFALRKYFDPKLSVRFIRSEFNEQVWSMFEINIVSNYFEVYACSKDAIASLGYSINTEEKLNYKIVG